MTPAQRLQPGQAPDAYRPAQAAFPDDVLPASEVTASHVDHDRFMLKPSVKATPKLLEEAARLLVESKRPVVLVGPEVTQSDAKLDVIALAERLSTAVTKGERLYDDFATDPPLFSLWH